MSPPHLSAEVVAQLQAHPLPGNVRELENLLHRALALSDGSQLQVDFAPSTAVPPPSASEPIAVSAAAPQAPAGAPAAVPTDLQAYLDQQEREILVKALRETNFNRTAAAQRLGLSLRQIRYRIARLAIATPGSDEADEPNPSTP
jgi:two-component system response regulator PilR (NtrC family)